MRKKKLFEFLTLITLSVGIVIGVGEFVKNDSKTPGNILNVSQNAVLATILWVVIGIASVFMILAFIEIASSTSEEGNGTISSWMQKLIGRRFGSFLALYWVFFYLPTVYCFFSIMATKFIFNTFWPNDFTKLSVTSCFAYLLPTLALLSFFAIGNTIFIKPGKYAQIIGTFLKTIPFALVLIFGVTSAFIHTKTGGNAYSGLTITPNWSRFFLTTGPILFSFDGFIMATNLQKETKNKELVYKALIVGMSIIACVYTLEAIALFSGTPDGSVLTLFKNFIHNSAIVKVFDSMIIFTICIGINGLTLAGSRYITTDTDAGLLCNFNRKISRRKSGLVQYGIALFYLFLLFSLGCFAGINGTFDPTQYMGLLSNVLVEFDFIIYIILIVAVIVNRFTKKIKVRKVRFMPIFSSIAALIFIVLTTAAIYFTLTDQGLVIRLLMFGILALLIIAYIINESLMLYYHNKNQLKIGKDTRTKSEHFFNFRSKNKLNLEFNNL